MLSALLVLLGFFAGLLGALTGIGGGVLLTPILALHFGIPIRQAIGTSLVAVITTSAASSSVHLQRHTTDIRLGMTLELATAFGAAVTAYLVGYFNRNVLEGLFAGFLLYSSITILVRGGKVKNEEEPAANHDGQTVIPPYEPQRYPLGLCASLVAGGLSGLLGIGGGPIKVPVMFLFMNVPLMVATATSNFMIGVTAAASALVYYRRGDILVDIAAPLAVGVFLGSLLGARVAPRIRTKYVVYLLVAIMFYLAGHLLVHLFKGPWLRAYIREQDLGRVKLGDKVKVTTDSFHDKVYDGHISFISSDAEFTPKQIQTSEERVKLVYRIKIDIDNSRHELKSNMPADAEILTGN